MQRDIGSGRRLIENGHISYTEADSFMRLHFKLPVHWTSFLHLCMRPCVHAGLAYFNGVNEQMPLCIQCKHTCCLQHTPLRGGIHFIHELFYAQFKGEWFQTWGKVALCDKGKLANKAVRRQRMLVTNFSTSETLCTASLALDATSAPRFQHPSHQKATCPRLQLFSLSI